MLLKFAGAAYLAYLGVRSLRGHASYVAPSAEPNRRPPLSDRAALRQGVLGNLLNPKAGVIFISVLPQFVRPGDAPIRLALMLLAFEVMILRWLTCYGALVSRAVRSRYGGRARHAIERATGVVMIGLGLRLAVARR